MWARLAVHLMPYIIIGGDVLKRAVRGIVSGQVFDENFLMSIATLGALVVGFLPDGEPQFAEAVFVMLFYQVGELFQSIAVGKSRRSIAALMDIRPDTANLEVNGEIVQVDVEQVAVGDVIVVMTGERVALDGVVISGATSLNTSALTGESLPREVAAGDTVISGCVNMNGVIRVRVTKTAGESTVTKILELVENSSENKARSENFITRFARWYTPAVVAAALLLAVLPPIISGVAFSAWLVKALSFLVVSCPCALVISVPLSFFGGIGSASRRGILIKGSNYIEALAKVETAVFDKTGTLTTGALTVKSVHTKGDEKELLGLAAAAEEYSSHPVALALKAACGSDRQTGLATDIEEVAGKGVLARVDGIQVAVGNERLMEHIGAEFVPLEVTGTVVYVARDGEFLGSIEVADSVKDGAADLLHRLKKAGVKRTVMLSGDRNEVAAEVAGMLGIDEYCAELLPEDKVAQVERLLAEKKPQGTLVFVGDGLNDAPVLSRADVGIAMGALGTDAALEAADAVLMDDDLDKLLLAVKISRRTVGIAAQNIAFALSVKALILVLGALGVTGLLTAVFADVGVAVIAILNAMRALRYKA